MHRIGILLLVTGMNQVVLSPALSGQEIIYGREQVVEGVHFFIEG